MHGRRLVADVDRTDIGVEKGVEGDHELVARHGEDTVDAGGAQRVREDVGAPNGIGCRHASGFLRRWAAKSMQGR